MKTKLLRVFALGLVIGTFIHCSGRYDEKLSLAVKRFNSGDRNAQLEIEDLLQKKISIDSWSSDERIINENAIYSIHENSVRIDFPFKQSLFFPNTIKELSLSFFDTAFAYSDGSHIFLKDANNSELQILEVRDKEPIKSVLLHDSIIIYYYNFQIHTINLSTKESRTLTKEPLYPPYKNYYVSLLKKSESYIGLISGIAGSYTLVVIDYTTGAIKLKIPAASSRFCIINNMVWYVGGSTGNWEIIKMNINTQSKTTIEKIASLSDITFTSDGYIYEKNEGLSLSDYAIKPVLLPVRYRLLGSCADSLVFQSKNRLFIAHFKDLLETVTRLDIKAGKQSH